MEISTSEGFRKTEEKMDSNFKMLNDSIANLFQGLSRAGTVNLAQPPAEQQGCQVSPQGEGSTRNPAQKRDVETIGGDLDDSGQPKHKHQAVADDDDEEEEDAASNI